MAKTNQTNSKSDVVFIGWKDTSRGRAVALFDVKDDEHPLYGTTVCELTLRKFQLQVPQMELVTE